MSGSLIRRKKCPYSEFFWSVFSRIQTEYFVYCILRLNTSVRMQENTDQRNSKYGHFSHSVIDLWWSKCLNSVKGNDSDTNNVNCYFFEIFLFFLFFFCSCLLWRCLRYLSRFLLNLNMFWFDGGYKKTSMREKCPNTELFWSVSSCIRTEYRKIRTEKTPYLDTFHAVHIFPANSYLYKVNNRKTRKNC